MDRISFGIGPIALGPSGSGIRERFAQLLAEALDLRVTLITARSYARLLRRCLDGELDLAWLPPALSARVVDSVDGAQLLLGTERVQPGFYRGAIFVAEDSPVRTLADLEDATIAWVDPNSSAGYLFPRFAMLANSVNPDTCFAEEQFLRSHEAVVKAVAAGTVDAGATYVHLAEASEDSRIVRSGWGDAGESMRPILMSRTIPVDTLCSMSPAAREHEAEVKAAFSKIHELPGADEVLRELLQISRFVPVDPKDYDIVRAALNVAHLPILGDEY